MADTTISAMNPAAPLTGAEVVPLVQGLSNVRSTVSAIAAAGAYKPPGVGAVATTVAAKLAQVISVFDFMTAAQQADSISSAGTIDATASIQAAINSLSASGGTIYFPAGAYLVSSVTVNRQCVLLGCGETSGSTLIKPSGASNVVFNCTANGGTIFRYFCFNPFSVTQAAGSAFIKFASTSSIGKVEDCLMVGWNIGVWIAGVSDFCIRNVRMEGGVAAIGTGILVDSGIAVNLETVIVTNSSAARPFAGIQINTAGDVTMVWCQFIQCVNGCYIAPNGGQVVASVHGVNSFYDNCGTYGLFIQPTATGGGGAVIRTRFTQCWFSSAGTSGVRLDTTLGGSIDGITFINPQIFLNGSHGFNSSGAAVINVKVIGAEIAQNSGVGFLSNGGQSKIEILGSTIGPIGAFSGNTAQAIQFLSGTSNSIIIANNRLSGNTGAALADASTGTSRWKTGNIGYNPIGASGVTVTASPFTYTAGDTPETLYVNGGTVSLITVAGSGVFQQTNSTVRLQPGVSAVFTYSSLPGIVTVKD